MSFGENLSELRRSRGITQKDLAASLTVTVQAISKWENNVCYPSADLYPIIAEFFGVSIDRLFGYSYVKEEDTVEDIERRVDTIEQNGDKIRALNDGLRKFPDSTRLKLSLAKVLTKVAKSTSDEKDVSTFADKAISLCQAVISSSESRDESDSALCLLCELYMLQGDLNQALLTSQRISELNYDARIRNEATIISGIYDLDNLVLFCKNNIEKCYKTVKCLIELLTDAYGASSNVAGAADLTNANEILTKLYSKYFS